MDDPEGYVTRIDCTAGGPLNVFLDDGPVPLITDDPLIQRVLAVVLAVQEKVILPLESTIGGKKIRRVQRAEPIPFSPHVGARISGIATQVDADTKKSFLEVFVTDPGGFEKAYRSSDLAIEAICDIASVFRKDPMIEGDRDNNIVKAALERV